MRLGLLILSILVLIFSGCKNPPKTRTLGDELLKTFGSYENVMKQHILILPWWLGEGWDHTVREVAPQNVPYVINTLKDCILYEPQMNIDQTENESHCAFFDGIILEIGSGKLSGEREGYVPYKSIIFSRTFLLTEYIYPTPQICRKVQYLAKWLYENSPPVPRFQEDAKAQNK